MCIQRMWPWCALLALRLHFPLHGGEDIGTNWCCCAVVLDPCRIWRVAKHTWWRLSRRWHSMRKHAPNYKKENALSIGRKHFPEVLLLKPGSRPDQGGQRWVCIHVYRNIDNMYPWMPLGDILNHALQVYRNYKCDALHVYRNLRSRYMSLNANW